jgi:phage shock protein E
VWVVALLTGMNWLVFESIGAVHLTLLAFKRASWVSEQTEPKPLQECAKVVDVRSAAECRSGHLNRAVNFPLDSILRALPRAFPDPNKVMLYQCLSSTRSVIAKRRLRNAGYKHAHNLGSLFGARKIVNQLHGA